MSSISIFDDKKKLWIPQNFEITRHAVLICHNKWSPHVFSDGKRTRESWKSADYLCVAWEPHWLQVRSLRAAARGTAHILALLQDGTLILLVKLSRTITDIREYQHIRKTLLDQLPAESPPRDTPAWYEPVWSLEVEVSRCYDSD